MALTRDFTQAKVPSISGSQDRTVGEWLTGDTVNLTACRYAIDADWSNAFVRAMATGKPIDIPYSPTPYNISTYIDLAEGCVILGKGRGAKRPTLFLTTNARAFRAQAVTNWQIENIIVDGNKAAVAGGNVTTLNDSVKGKMKHVLFKNAKASLALTGNSTGNDFDDVDFEDCGSTQIEFGGAGVILNNIRRSSFKGGVGFGVWMRDGANGNLVEGCRTIDNGLELVGVTYDCHSNRICNNHAENCGDNGISITGFNNVVIGNICRNNAFMGIYVYGKFNAITGNECLNNGQAYGVTSQHYSGIAIGGFSGGTAQFNMVSGNFIDDNQAAPTQYHCIRIYPSSYVAWASAATIVLNEYRVNGNNIYKALTAGAAGATAPAHTSGDVSDGGVTWRYVGAFLGSTREAYSNTVGPNRVGRSIGATVQDDTVNKSNNVFTDAGARWFGGGDTYITGNLRRRATAWVSGVSVVYGDQRYSPTTNNVYRVSSLGGTSTVEPVHGSGNVTGADGFQWTHVAPGQEANVIRTAGSLTILDAPGFTAADSTIVIRDLAGAGSPEGKVTAPVGSSYRRTDGGAGTTFYVKESGTGATGWVAK